MACLARLLEGSLHACSRASHPVHKQIVSLRNAEQAQDCSKKPSPAASTAAGVSLSNYLSRKQPGLQSGMIHSMQCMGCQLPFPGHSSMPLCFGTEINLRNQSDGGRNVSEVMGIELSPCTSAMRIPVGGQRQRGRLAVRCCWLQAFVAQANRPQHWPASWPPACEPYNEASHFPAQSLLCVAKADVKLAWADIVHQ